VPHVAMTFETATAIATTAATTATDDQLSSAQHLPKIASTINHWKSSNVLWFFVDCCIYIFVADVVDVAAVPKKLSKNVDALNTRNRRRSPLRYD